MYSCKEPENRKPLYGCIVLEVFQLQHQKADTVISIADADDVVKQGVWNQ